MNAMCLVIGVHLNQTKRNVAIVVVNILVILLAICVELWESDETKGGTRVQAITRKVTAIRIVHQGRIDMVEICVRVVCYIILS